VTAPLEVETEGALLTIFRVLKEEALVEMLGVDGLVDELRSQLHPLAIHAEFGLVTDAAIQAILHFPHPETQVAVLCVGDVERVGAVDARHPIVIRHCSLRNPLIEHFVLLKERTERIIGLSE